MPSLLLTGIVPSPDSILVRNWPRAFLLVDGYISCMIRWDIAAIELQKYGDVRKYRNYSLGRNGKSFRTCQEVLGGTEHCLNYFISLSLLFLHFLNEKKNVHSSQYFQVNHFLFIFQIKFKFLS